MAPAKSFIFAALFDNLVQFRQVPLGHRQQLQYGVPQLGARQQVKPRIGGCPDQLTIPLDEYIVGISRVASGFLKITTLRRDEVGRYKRILRIADVITLQAGIEESVTSEVGVGFSRRFEMRRIMHAEAAALLTEIVVGRFLRRPRYWQRRYFMWMRRITDIDDVGAIDRDGAERAFLYLRAVHRRTHAL